MDVEYWNVIAIFISGCATAGGEFPGGVVFSFIFVTFIAMRYHYLAIKLC